MSYHGTMYIAQEHNDQRNVIDSFMESDHKSLLIIDPHLAIEYIKDLRADYNCFVVFLNEKSEPSQESRNIIYIHQAFDLMVQNFLIRCGGLVAFF